MSYSITIVDKFHYHASVLFGLDIQGSTFPVFVGCSLLTPKGEVVDLPAQWLNTPGLALWKIKADDRFQNPAEPNPMSAFTPWYGKIIFALYTDDTFENRLTDTGWVEWSAQWLIGSSTKGLDMQDDAIKRKYGKRLDVWTDQRPSKHDPLGIR
jgi:hypothetical protein